MPVTVKILDTRRIPSGAPERVGQFDVIITYQIDPLRTYIITLPEEEATEEKIKEAIRKDIEERGKWIGRELEIPGT